MNPRKMLGLFLAAALLAAATGAAPAGEGKLERIREEVEDDDDDDRGGRRRRKSDGCHIDWDYDGDFLDDVAAVVEAAHLALRVLGSPFWIPMELTGDCRADRPFRFERYPYADGAEGYLRSALWSRQRSDERPETAPEDLPADRPEMGAGDGSDDRPEEELRECWAPVEGHELSATALLSYERHSDGIGGLRGEVQLRTRSRFNLDLSATDYAEDVDGEVEHLGHFKGHVTYSFAVSRHAVFSAGLGARVLAWEGGESYGGVDFRYEAEFFPVRPLHLHAIAEAGWVGEEAAWELEGRVGLLWKRAELFVGYRYFSVAGEKLAGPTVGLGVWF